jgi:GDPmannose 4,6-dehydratase
LDDENFHLVSGDLTDPHSLDVLAEKQFDEWYNLGAQSFVQESFNTPAATFEINAMGVVHSLEAIRKRSPKTRFYQAGTSEQFGHPRHLFVKPDTTAYMSEETEFHPRSPYGVSKVAAHHAVQVAREAYGVFGCVGILFNHESELRGEEFVTTKVCKAAVEIAAGRMDRLHLGNINARRDWGYSPDYVKAMCLMLLQDEPDDYVLATGQTRSIRELCEVAFKCVGLEKSIWEYVAIDNDAYTRPADVEYLLGDSTKAREKLGWEPEISFEVMIKCMCDWWQGRLIG